VLRRLTDPRETRPDRSAMVRVAQELLSGHATHAQMAALLTALRLRGETLDDLVAFASIMREKATAVPGAGNLVTADLCGTGGDHSGTFNISTAASFVAAAAGVYVAKHGNRAASSKCGSADVLEALGVKITASPEVMGEALAQDGICFLFAQSYHGSMRHVAPVRRELGLPTIFNMLGPLSNPAGVRRQLVGTANPLAFDLYPDALQKLGIERALVIRGEGGLDEISPYGTTVCREVGPAGVQEFRITPAELGRRTYALADLRGGETANEAAEILLAVLDGRDRGARREAVVLNAGAAIYIADQAASLEEGFVIAEEHLDRGDALAKLKTLAARTHR